MKRLLCILSSLTAGGAETFLMKVYRTLPLDEYKMDFIVNENDGCYTQEVLERGGHIYQIPFRKKDPAGAFKGITKIVRENGYTSVLKVGNTPIAVLDLLAAKLGGAKVLGMRSCNALTNLSHKEKLVNSLLRPILNIVTNVKIAPSMLAAEFTFGKYNAHRNVHLLNNGLNLNVFCFDEEGRYSIRKKLNILDSFVVGHIGRFHEQKNHLFLLEVFQKIHQKKKDAVLLLIGTGDLEGKIRQKVKELNLDESVLFLGQRFDIPQLLSAMDVFLFPSLHEGMPNTVIEAQATSLPCVLANTITPEADITGLVSYLSLKDDMDLWAETAISVVVQSDRNVSMNLENKGYDIKDTAKKLISLMFP